jgi:calcineurin-like phosphoesterase
MVFLGDINGAAGKTALEKHLPALRERWSPDVVIANAENARNGSGLTPELYRTFRSWGIDAITLGDHVFRDPKIVPMLEKPEEPIARPANLSGRAPGKRWSRIPASGTRTRDIYICTVLGRIFFPLPANDPFAAIDDVLGSIPERKPILVSRHTWRPPARRPRSRTGATAALRWWWARTPTCPRRTRAS